MRRASFESRESRLRGGIAAAAAAAADRLLFLGAGGRGLEGVGTGCTASTLDI